MRAATAGWRVVAAGTLALAVIGAGCRTTVDTAESPGTTVTTTRINTNLVESTDAPMMGGTLRYGLAEESNGWNPALNQWAASGLQVARTIFDTLAAYDETATPQPFLLRSFDHNADHTEWTLVLRPGVTLHNGKAVTAQTIVRNQNYFKASPITGPAYRLVDSFEAVDDLTVRVKMRSPFANFPLLLTTQVAIVADPDWLESGDSLHPVGTGPFSLKSWEVGSSLRVVRNPTYWMKDASGRTMPYLDAVDFTVMNDADSRANAMRTGQIDVMETRSALQLADFQADDNYQSYANPNSEVAENFIQLNTSKPPFDDVDARRALAYATDQDAVAEVMGAPASDVADNFLSPSSPWYVDSGYPSYDPDKARELVEKVKARHGSFSFKLLGGTDGLIVRQAQALQQLWQDVGIDVRLETNEQSQAIIRVIAGDYNAVSWVQFDGPNPMEDSAFWRPDEGTGEHFAINFTRFQDAQLSAALDEVHLSSDPAVMKDALATIQRRFGDQVPYVWLVRQPTYIVATDGVVNLVRWTLPGGQPGLDLYRASHMLSQAWKRPA